MFLKYAPSIVYHEILPVVEQEGDAHSAVHRLLDERMESRTTRIGIQVVAPVDVDFRNAGVLEFAQIRVAGVFVQGIAHVPPPAADAPRRGGVRMKACRHNGKPRKHPEPFHGILLSIGR